MGNKKVVPEKNGNKSENSIKKAVSVEDSIEPTTEDSMNGYSRSNSLPDELKNSNEEGENKTMTLKVIDQSKIIEEVFKKPNDLVRNNFLKTLQSNKILTDKPAVKEQNIIIFDWDD